MRINVLCAIALTINAVGLIVLYVMGFRDAHPLVNIISGVVMASLAWIIVIVCNQYQEVKCRLDARVKNEDFDREARKYRMNGSAK